MHILGISAWYHDAAVCVVRDGAVVAACEEEKFTRKKHDARFPVSGIRWALADAGISGADIDAVVFYEKPVQKFTRILETLVSVAPRGVRDWKRFVPSWFSEKLRFEARVRECLPDFRGEILFSEHHLSHAASAYFPSPFAKAAVLTVDGVGEWATTSIARGDGASLEMLEEIRFPHSIGLLYSAFTQWLGFRVNSGEYKVMGLAPYGEPKYSDLIREKLIDLRADGSFRLREPCLEFLRGTRMTGAAFHRVLGGPPREPEGEILPVHFDMARSIQDVVEEAMLRLAARAMEAAGSRNLCLAGGVALNCVANGRLLREAGLDGLWIQPAAGDAGGALGAALAAWHGHFGKPRERSTQDGAPQDAMGGARLGPAVTDDGATELLRSRGIPCKTLAAADLAPHVAGLLASGATVGWAQGRAEFGPRALGNRSILADPRSTAMQRHLNLQIKHRESFRPFAPAVLLERSREWFDLEGESPYMLLVAPVTVAKRKPVAAQGGGAKEATGLRRLDVPRSEIPAVTHVDFSARVQTVGPAAEPRFRDLLLAFEAQTGCPVLVNTSFNVRGEPTVLTAEDALRTFLRTNLDVLVLGRSVVKRSELPEAMRASAVAGPVALD